MKRCRRTSLLMVAVSIALAMQAFVFWTFMTSTTTSSDEKRLSLAIEKRHTPATASSNSTFFWSDLKLQRRRSKQPLEVSDVHCVGETFRRNDSSSWIHRSCAFQHVCYDFTLQDFVVVPSKSLGLLERELTPNRTDAAFVSTLLRPPWATWVPRYEDVSNNNKKSYYSLPDDVVLIPFMASRDMRHAIWDVLLPVYMMLSDFDLLEKYRIALVDVGSGTDDKRSCGENCRVSIEAFLPLLQTTRIYTLPSSMIGVDRICAPHAVAIMRLLSQEGSDRPLRLHGRGRTLWEFRQHMLQNLAIQEETSLTYTVVLVGHTLSTEAIASIQQAFSTDDTVRVRHYASLDSLSLKERIQIACQSSMFISDGRDAEYSVYGLFVPQGGSVVLVGGEDRPNGDWAYIWSHMSHVRAHWITVDFLSNGGFVQLIQQEIQAFRERETSGHDSRNHDKAFFAGRPVTFVNSTLQSDIHCTEESSAFSRVCEYRNLCFDLTKQTFVLPRSNEQAALESHVTDRMRLSSVSSSKTVMLGGLKEAFFTAEPVSSSSLSVGYYELDPRVVWLLFHPVPITLKNPGHAMWDTLLPLFTQESMFFWNENIEPLLISMNPRCIYNHPKIGSGCARNVHKYMSLLGIANYTSIKELELIDEHGSQRSNYVCGRSGVAGMPILTDHGENRHGWDQQDYLRPHNTGRGRHFWDFRSYAMKNTEVLDQGAMNHPVVTFSVNSSTTPVRNQTLQHQITALNQTGVTVQAFHFLKMTLKEQIQVVSKSSVYVSTTGGSTGIAMFLPRGASLILFYDDVDELRDDGGPAYLDWDFWVNAGYLRVHWLPISTMDEDIGLFVALVQYELDVQRNRWRR